MSTIHHKVLASGSHSASFAKASMGFKRAQPAVSVTALQEVPPVATILHMEVHMHSDDQRLSNKPHCRHLVRRCHRSLSSGSRRQAAAHITFSGSSSSPSSLSHCSRASYHAVPGTPPLPAGPTFSVVRGVRPPHPCFWCSALSCLSCIAPQYFKARILQFANFCNISIIFKHYFKRTY